MRFVPLRFGSLQVRGVVAAVCILVLGDAALADEVIEDHQIDQPDRVWLQPISPTSAQSAWYPPAIATRSGRVVDFDSKQLRLVVDGDEEETLIAAHRVIWIEVGGPSPLEVDLIRQFADQNFASSLSKLPALLQTRPPVWRQQWLTMLGACAAWKSSRSKIALDLVSQLDRRPLPPLVLAWLPIAWNNGVQSPDAVSAAREHLDNESSAARLTAASWLLSSSERGRAVTVLKQLADAKDRDDIAELARCVLWRIATPVQVEQSGTTWQERLDGLPMVYQVGPTVALMNKLQSAGQNERAQRLRWSLELTPIHPHPTLLNNTLQQGGG